MSRSLVLGFFDGVHKAHRRVIESAFEHSENVTLITFKETPALYFGAVAEYILSRENSVNKIKQLGVNDIVELEFSEIAGMTATSYLDYLISTYQPVSISTGFNHTFGLNKSGDASFLKANENRGYKYICVPPVADGDDIISSTLIKKYIKDGKVEKANSLLESKFLLEGTVIHGAKIGRTIGFPTANIKYPENIVKLPFGVYAADVTVADKADKVTKMKGIMNWGMKPTLNNTVEPVAEIHILNFDDDLYGKFIRAEVIKQIRGEKKFESLDELKNQIKKDIEHA